MRKILLFACTLFGFMACTQKPIEEHSVICADAPKTIRVGFEGDDTRIQLNESQKTVWTKDDLVSVFYRSDANQKWQYQGETGEHVGDLKCVANATSTTNTTKTVVVYPYSESYWLNTDSFAIDAVLPATQYYAEDSYGVGSNLMVSQSEFTQFYLKSVCGWLKLQLTGDGKVVNSIRFRGNNGEQVAGLIYVDTATAESTLASEMGGTDDNNAGGNLVFDDTILMEVVLDCGAGVELGSETTSFYISLPPQTFEKGFTVEIECKGYEPMIISTEKSLVIERNTIQPMASVEVEAKRVTSGYENGYKWVDLGLSVRWATCNVGATAPEEYGDFFAWGEVTPKEKYGSNNCTTYNVSDDISGNSQYDAATANWGSSWRMPTNVEQMELVNDCIWTWTSLNGVNGVEVTGPNGDSIFLPAVGYRNGSSSIGVGSYGGYWSSIPSGVNYGAYYLFFRNGSQGCDCYDRYYGRSVRPVLDYE